MPSVPSGMGAGGGGAANGVPVRTSAAWIAPASRAGVPRPAMCMYITWGDSCRRWLCSAVCSIPPSWSWPRTGAISLSSKTRSPMRMASVSLTCVNATHEPSASVGLTTTPAAVTCRSLRGRPILYAPSGCSAPGLPSPWSTCFQSMGARGRCACPSTTIRASPAMTHTALYRMLLQVVMRFGQRLLGKISAGTLVAFKRFAAPRADGGCVAALPDAVYPPVRLRRVIRGPGVLSDQPRPECVPNRHAADPHAGRRHGCLPLPHDARRSDRAAAHADHRCHPHGGRRFDLRLYAQPCVSGRRGDDRRDQPQWQRSRALSPDRAGRAGACGSQSDADDGIRLVHPCRLVCDRCRLTRWRGPVAPATEDGDGARRELPYCCP